MFKFWTLCVFKPPFEGLGTTYNNHLRLIGKCVVDFLVVLIKLFSLGVTGEMLRATIGSKSAILLQRFQVEGVAPTNHSSSETTRLNDLSYGVKIWTYFSTVLAQFKRLTDRQKFSLLDRVCILQCGKK